MFSGGRVRDLLSRDHQGDDIKGNRWARHSKGLLNSIAKELRPRFLSQEGNNESKQH
jgi:hypothetical protein